MVLVQTVTQKINILAVSQVKTDVCVAQNSPLVRKQEDEKKENEKKRAWEFFKFDK